MNITEELVDRICALSHLSLREEEKAPMREELERILAYMEVLEELDTDGVEPMSHVLPLKNVFRRDEAEPSTDREELLQNAPARDEAAFLAPKTVDRGDG